MITEINGLPTFGMTAEDVNNTLAKMDKGAVTLKT